MEWKIYAVLMLDNVHDLSVKLLTFAFILSFILVILLVPIYMDDIWDKCKKLWIASVALTCLMVFAGGAIHTFVPTTKQALKDEPDAGKAFCDWAIDLAHEWRNVRHFCGAHSGLVVFEEGQFEAALLSAIDNARSELEAK